MVGVLITGHGNFATGLKTSVELIAGASDYFKYVDFPEPISPETRLL